MKEMNLSAAETMMNGIQNFQRNVLNFLSERNTLFHGIKGSQTSEKDVFLVDLKPKLCYWKTIFHPLQENNLLLRTIRDDSRSLTKSMEFLARYIPKLEAIPPINRIHEMTDGFERGKWNLEALSASMQSTFNDADIQLNHWKAEYQSALERIERIERDFADKLAKINDENIEIHQHFKKITSGQNIYYQSKTQSHENEENEENEDKNKKKLKSKKQTQKEFDVFVMTKIAKSQQWSELTKRVNRLFRDFSTQEKYIGEIKQRQSKFRTKEQEFETSLREITNGIKNIRNEVSTFLQNYISQLIRLLPQCSTKQKCSTPECECHQADVVTEAIQNYTKALIENFPSFIFNTNPSETNPSSLSTKQNTKKTSNPKKKKT
jgi:hypothetical protein